MAGENPWGKPMGTQQNPWENHRKTMGKPWENHEKSKFRSGVPAELTGSSDAQLVAHLSSCIFPAEPEIITPHGTPRMWDLLTSWWTDARARDAMATGPRETPLMQRQRPRRPPVNG